MSEGGNRFAKIIRPALKHTDSAILNEFEAERTTGLQIRTEQGVDAEQLRAAARNLLEAGVREWIIIHFPEGASAVGRDGSILSQASVQIPQKNIGTTGAGDAFGAGLLYRLHEEQPMEECLHYAVCVAAACLTEASCSGGVCSLAQCLEIGQTYGFRAEEERRAAKTGANRTGIRWGESLGLDKLEC